MARIRRTTPLLAASILLLALAPFAQAQPASSPSPLVHTPDGRPLHQWNPSESWPGGSHYDARVDQPVHFWRAGLALSEVLSSLTDQTGVRFGFFPEGDENPRVRVNLYLNPDQPPTLRDLMAQLMWVTDCIFAHAEAGPGERGPTYYLLGTSLGQGVPSAQRAQAKTAYERAVEERTREWDRLGEALMQKLDDLKQALELPRAAVISRYKYVDDIMLLTLLDPQRRAAAQYVCTLFAENEDPWKHRPWDELSEEERTLVRRAFPLDDPWPKDAVLMVGPMRPICDMGGWVERGLDVASYFVGPAINTEISHDTQLLRTWGYLSVSDTARLGRLLGDQVPEDEESESAYFRKWRDSAERAVEEVKLQTLQQTFLKERSLSQETTDFLSSLGIPLESGRDYALWQVQRAVADSSGLNIVSDCFWQAARPLVNTETALSALETACHPRPEKLKGRTKRLFWVLAWEWGDAGSFLRFRSADREMWRASLLPPDVLVQIDNWLAPRLEQVLQSDKPWHRFPLEFPQDIERILTITSQLDDVQLEYGARMIYEDPTDDENAWKHALREAFLCQPIDNVDYFRLFASFTDSQWQHASGAGFDCSELTDPQLSRLQSAMARHGVLASKDAIAATSLTTRGSFPGPGREGVRDPSKEDCLFNVAVEPPRPSPGMRLTMLSEYLSLDDVYGGPDWWDMWGSVSVRRPAQVRSGEPAGGPA